MTGLAPTAAVDEPVAVKTAPLSFLQEQLWIVEQLAPDRALYTETLGLRLRGDLSVGALERSLREIGRRHEVLRTTFPLVDGRPVQRVMSHLPVSLAPIDLSPAPEPEAILDQMARELAELPCDLARATIFRAWLLRLGERDHALVIVGHHALGDGWSMGLILAELKALYEAFRAGRESPLPEPELQYSDFAFAERELLETGVLEEDLRYWTEKLSGAPLVLELAGDHPRPPRRSLQGRREEFPIGDHLASALRRFSGRHGATVFATALAGFAALVHRSTGRTDFVLGTLAANRDRPELARMVGCLANTLPLRLDLGGDPSFRELLARCRETCFEALDHQHVAFEKLVEALGPRRDPRHPLLVQHLFLLKEVPRLQDTLAGLEVTSFEVPRNRARFDTIVEVEVGPDRLRGWVEYDTALFERDTVSRLMREYGRLLEACLADPERRLSELTGLEGGESSTRTGAAGPPALPGGSRAGADTAADGTRARPGGAGADPVPGPHAAVLQTLLGDIWREVMELDRVGPDDDFFELGGHSMLAAQLAQRIRETLQIDLPLRAIFEHPTVAGLSAGVARAHPELASAVQALAGLSEEAFHALVAGSEGAAAPAAQPDAPILIPLSLSQEQFWVIDRLAPARSVYSIPLSIRVHGPLDVDALRQAINGVVARQQVLRATFPVVDEVPRQRIAPALVLDVPLLDLAGLPPDEQCVEARRLEREVAYHVFDVEHGPPLRAALVRLATDHHLVLLDFDHLVTDEVSTTVFARELSALYRAHLEGRPPDLPELRLQYAEYVTWERQWMSPTRLARLQRFWRHQLQGVPRLELPTDRPRPAHLTFDGIPVARSTPDGLFEGMAALARRQHATPYMVLLAATAEVVHRLGGQERFLIGVPSENRNRPGAELLMGAFVTAVPVRIDCDGDPTFVELLGRVRERLLAAYAHQGLPIGRIAEAAGEARLPNRTPLVQVTCELQLGGWLPFDLPGCRVDYEVLTHDNAAYEMAFHSIAKPERLELGVQLNANIWEEATGHRLLADLEAGLCEVVADPTRPLSTYRFRAAPGSLVG